MPTAQNSKSQTGLGTLFSIGGVAGATGTEVFTLVGELNKSPLEFPKWKTTPTTNFQSTIETVGKAIPGVTEIQVSGSRVGTDAGQIKMLAAYAAQGAYDFTMVLPLNSLIGQTTAGDSIAFTAKVLGVKYDVEADKTISFEATLVYDSLPVITPGT